jgi:hypothetical protein
MSIKFDFDGAIKSVGSLELGGAVKSVGSLEHDL